VTEFRLSLESMLDPSGSDREAIESTIAELEESVKTEFRRMRTGVGAKKIGSGFFEPYAHGFQRVFKEAGQVVRSASQREHSYAKYCRDAAVLSDGIGNGLLPFVELLSEEVGELSNLRLAVQVGDANQSVQFGALRRQLWDLEGRAAAQEIAMNSLRGRLSGLAPQIGVPDLNRSRDVSNEAISGAISELRELCNALDSPAELKFRELVGKLQYNRMRIEKMRQEFLMACELPRQVVRFPVERTEVTRNEVPGKTELSKIPVRRSLDERVTRLHSVLNSMHQEHETQLEHTKMFLEALQANEIAHRTHIKRQRDPSLREQSERTLYHY
jgi:ribosomal protein L29